MNIIRRIQAISAIRANRWHGGDFRAWSGLEWAGAMCGEAGEAANVAKKLKRIEDGISGNAFSEVVLNADELTAKLGRECADTFIYMTLVAERYGIDLQKAIIDAFNKKSEEMGFPERIADDGEEQWFGQAHE